uniref:Uncharacterized protein n=1 Tax=Chaetoceros debilis TaxID=122233 RepID=A0A7S3V8A2_9STRA|mmetsp:Transcript_18939/g.28792  ORF Transcript_18939/g.28792 Transcript_18939/m.28792 type:complete len:109 (-) Transcript_18939:716-1042(-)
MFVRMEVNDILLNSPLILNRRSAEQMGAALGQFSAHRQWKIISTSRFRSLEVLNKVATPPNTSLHFGSCCEIRRWHTNLRTLYILGRSPSSRYFQTITSATHFDGRLP